MGDHFTPTGAALPMIDRHIVIALYPEGEVALPLNHVIVGLLIAIELFHVFDVAFNITAAASHAQVHDVRDGHHRDEDCQRQEGVQANGPAHQAAEEYQVED